MRRDQLGRALAALGTAVTSLWDQVVASDPGLVRLLMAARGTSAVFLMTITAVVLGRLLQASPFEFASGITLSLMASFLLREPTRWQRQRTLVMLAVPSALSTVATTLLHGHGPLGDCFFLVLVFGCFLLQGRSPAAMGQGFVAVVTSYVGLYLELPPASLPIQLLSVVVAVPVTGLACFVLLPMRPARTLHRMVQAVQARAALVLRHARGLAPDAPATIRRLSRSLARLNEAALAADDQLGVLEAAGSAPLRRHLMDLELAAARLAIAPLDSIVEHAGRHAARLRVAERRLRRSRWSARDLRPTQAARNSSVSAALADITRTAAALSSASTLTAAPPVRTPPPPPGPLAWRIALRVTLAAALAMAGGMMLSPNRWFWAVITVYLLFVNTRSRGETVYKGVQRMGGTLVGLMVGVSLASLLQGNGVAEMAVLAAAIFGMYYAVFASYTVSIFCVTVMLGVLYNLLGADMGPLLVLRLEETVIGATAAIIVAVCVLPVRTREQVTRSGVAALQALAEAIGSCRRVLAGDPGTLSPLQAMRVLDRQMADLRLALLPLTVGRFALQRSEAERPVQALLDCVYWARMLAVSITGPDAMAASHAEAIEQRVAALAAGDRSAPGVFPRAPSESGPSTQTALDQLDRATATLAERLAIGALHGFQREGGVRGA